MVFWILLGVAVLAIVVTIVMWWLEDGPALAALFGFGVLFVSAIVLLIFGAVATGCWSYLTKTETATYELRALDTGSTISGRSYFLGGGYIDGHRTLNYIKQNGAWAEVDDEWAEDSRVFEDSTSPTVTERVYTWGNPWLFPWDSGQATDADFHIPSGSILENYSIDNG